MFLVMFFNDVLVGFSDVFSDVASVVSVKLPLMLQVMFSACR